MLLCPSLNSARIQWSLGQILQGAEHPTPLNPTGATTAQHPLRQALSAHLPALPHGSAKPPKQESNSKHHLPKPPPRTRTPAPTLPPATEPETRAPLQTAPWQRPAPQGHRSPPPGPSPKPSPLPSQPRGPPKPAQSPHLPNQPQAPNQPQGPAPRPNQSRSRRRPEPSTKPAPRPRPPHRRMQHPLVAHSPHTATAFAERTAHAQKETRWGTGPVHRQLSSPTGDRGRGPAADLSDRRGRRGTMREGRGVALDGT